MDCFHSAPTAGWSSLCLTTHTWCALVQSIIASSKLPKKLLQTSLRPILTDLSAFNKLNLPMLRGLGHLLELLATWFNNTLGVHPDGWIS